MNQNSMKPWFPEGRVRHASLRTEAQNLQVPEASRYSSVTSFYLMEM